MAGPIIKTGSDGGSWVSRSPIIQTSAPATVPTSLADGLPSVPNATQSGRFLTPSAPLRDSPLPASPTSPNLHKTGSRVVHAASAPPEMAEPFRRISQNISPPHASTFEEKLAFRLDRNAPARAVRVPDTVVENSQSPPEDSADETASRLANLSLGRETPFAHSEGRPQPQPVQRQPDSILNSPADRIPSPSSRASWGTSFPVVWIRVQPLPFTRTRHLRNPWNADREVKVSRDGTELEPSIGRQLLAQWDGLPTTPPLPQPKKGANPRNASSRRG